MRIRKQIEKDFITAYENHFKVDYSKRTNEAYQKVIDAGLKLMYDEMYVDKTFKEVYELILKNTK